MAEKDDGIASQSFRFAEKVFDSIWQYSGPHDVWHWVTVIAIAGISLLFLLYLTLKAAKAAFEALSKIIEAYKSSGLPLLQSNNDKRKVRRRMQFCAVLDADLAYIAKAESWNDQYFTDLEAEVESEGGYYATALHRLLKKKSQGLRKERSLMTAIVSSTEKAIQLVGEPGAGKSVALRHLAKQFAERGKRSKDTTATVPLYINLRELNCPDIDRICADDIKNFVLDNIRRGDADTSAYVRENWDDYRERGIWLFLLDSFDEIPAVLHAETGSLATRKFSEAIRQFLEGMGDCKGVLASREFKGPESLPWTKFRILPLTTDKQDELVQNSFLSDEQISYVRQHLAASDNSLKATPLFLTLLCRYVREESRAPLTDHDLLERHIERLARRDATYIDRRYGLSPEALVKGAEEIARLFAENAAMSLSPTIDQISAGIDGHEIPGGNIHVLVAALVDSKIGRTDFPNASPGDKRFAFSHRRYQETLFVKYLGDNPGHLSPHDLLTDVRWREYAVTMLQTRTSADILPFLQEAEQIILNGAHQQVRHPAEAPLDKEFGYYNWNGEPIPSLLLLLEEGIARRRSDFPETLSRAVEKFLRVRWERGDLHDRIQVVRHGALLPNDTLISYISFLFDIGTESSKSVAFKQTQYVANVPAHIQGDILNKLADESLECKDKAASLRLEALAARLPVAIGARYVVRRCNALRKVYSLSEKLSCRILPIDQIITNIGSIADLSVLEKNLPMRQRDHAHMGMLLTSTAFIVMAIAASKSIFCKCGVSPTSRDMWYAVYYIPLLTYSRYIFLYIFRARGEKISLRTFVSSLTALLSKKHVIFGLLYGVAALAILAASAYGAGYAARMALNAAGLNIITNNEEQLFGGLSIICVIIYSWMLASFFRDRKKDIISKERLNFLLSSTASEIDIMLKASDAKELLRWINTEKSLTERTEVIRSLSSTINAHLDKAATHATLPTFFASKVTSRYRVKRLAQAIEYAMDDVGTSEAAADIRYMREAVAPES